MSDSLLAELLSRPGSHAVLTVEGLRRLHARVLKAEDEAAAAQRKATALRQQYESIATVLTSLDSDVDGATNDYSEAPETWTGQVMSVLRQSEMGFLSYSELLAELAKGPLADRMESADKSFYNALSRLEEAKELFRYDSHAWLPHAWKSFKGEALPPQDPERITTIDALLEAVAASNKPLTAAELIEWVIKNYPKGAGQSLRSNPNTAYTALTRLVKRGKIIKNENSKTYQLSRQAGIDTKNPSASAEAEGSRGGDVPPLNGRHLSLWDR